MRYIILLLLSFMMPFVVHAATGGATEGALLERQKTERIEPFAAADIEKKILEIEQTGNMQDQYILGYMYEYGLNILQDFKKAERWYEKASENGHTKAMLALGRLYRSGKEGQGVPRSINRALSWFHAAAKAGDPNGWYELGLVYEAGDGVFQNDKKAFAAYQVAAEGGVLNAHVKLGIFYQYGRGVEKDIRSAIKHYKELGEKTTNPNVKKRVSILLGGVYAEVASAQSELTESMKWYRVAAEHGDVASQTKLADALRDGVGVDQNYLEAIEWYRKAAAQGNVYAMDNLGYIYSNGLGLERNYPEALKWYKAAAERGSAEAAWNLGTMYRSGIGVMPDVDESKKWYERSERLRTK